MTLLRLILFLLTFSIHFGYVAAQNLFQTVRGSITDKKTKIPLTGANILLLESTPPLGATTDSKGNFRI